MCEIMERIAKQERKEGMIEGMIKGQARGETRINQLNAILIQLKRYDDLERATLDSGYQAQLMIELLPEEV